MERMKAKVKVDNIIYGKGKGRSKKDAEQEAARVALSKRAKLIK